jgi:hypothetical protein
VTYSTYPRYKQPQIHNFLQFSKSSINVYEGFSPHFSGRTTYDVKLRELPPTGDTALEEIADGTDVAAASKAVYLAGISGTERGVALARSKLKDSRIHVRVAASAALKTHSPTPSGGVSLAVNPDRRVKPRSVGKGRKRRIPTRPASKKFKM